MNNNVEDMLSERSGQRRRSKARRERGVIARRLQARSCRAKPVRIQVQDEVEEAGGGDGSGKHITIDDLGEIKPRTEGRGLRADIDY